MVAPVALIGLDEMAREDLAGSEIDDRDLPLVNDGEDTAAGMGRADLEVVHAAAAPEGHDALGVGDVVAEAEVAAAVGFRRPCLRPRPVRLARCGSTNRTVRPLLVVGEAEGVELSLEPGEADLRRPLPKVAFEGLVETLDLALGLRVTRRAILLADAKVGEQVLEAVASSGEA